MALEAVQGRLTIVQQRHPLKFSVVAISLNSTRLVEQCIQSVLAQDYSPFKHVIVGSGSTDGILEILCKYDHLVWVSEPHEGRATLSTSVYA